MVGRIPSGLHNSGGSLQSADALHGQIKPSELQAMTITKRHFMPELSEPASSRITGTFTLMGVGTFADLLALGHDGLRRQPHYKHLRPESIASIIRAVPVHTGYEFPEESAMPAGLLRYFDDVGEASVVLGLPSAPFWDIYDTGLGDGLAKIGNVLHLRPDQLAANPRVNHQIGLGRLTLNSLCSFVENDLGKKIVEPFNEAKAASRKIV